MVERVAALLAIVSLINSSLLVHSIQAHPLFSPANHVGFQFTHSQPHPRSRHLSFATSCRTMRSISGSDRQLSIISSPKTIPKSSRPAALFLQTNEREAVNDADHTSKIINGNTSSINGINGAKTTYNSSSDLVEFFERIFEKESFGALANITSSDGHVNLNSGDSDGTVDDALLDIRRSIKSLTAGAEENNVPDILSLTVNFANEVYQNITGDNVDGGADAVTIFDDLPTEIANSITELFRQLEVALDERFVEACEEIAFYDVQGLRSDKDAVPGPKRLLEEDYERMRREGEIEREKSKKDRAKELAEMLRSKASENTTQTDTFMDEVSVTSKGMRTADIIRNLNSAPIFYSIALTLRWIQKASVPPLSMLMFFRGLAYPFTTSVAPTISKSKLFGKRVSSDSTNGRVKTFGDEEIADEEFIRGWKQTGEIAAKGKRGRALATFRRSAEIWFCFSSFYIKDTWILKNYNSGRWSKTRFEEERKKLGGQLTQNLLRLGPTFIKVSLSLCVVNISTNIQVHHYSFFSFQLGQIFSTRIDIVPKEYLEQLKLLQDNVPAFSGAKAVEIIEYELGKPIGELFDTFNNEPLAGKIAYLKFAFVCLT